MNHWRFKALKRTAKLLLQAILREGLLPMPSSSSTPSPLQWQLGPSILKAQGRVYLQGQRLTLDALPRLDAHSAQVPIEDGLSALIQTLKLLNPNPHYQHRCTLLHNELIRATAIQAAAYQAMVQRPQPQTWEDFEAWTPEGHNLHPCAKTRAGFSNEDLRAASPEFCLNLELPWMGIHQSLLTRVGIIPQEFELDSKHWAVPIHPWQKAHILPKIYPQEIGHGLLFPLDRSTISTRISTSVRTVHPLDPRLPLFKLALGSLMTSTERSMSRQTILSGPIYSEILDLALRCQPGWGQDVTPLKELGGFCWSDPLESGPKARQLSFLVRERLTEPHGLVAVPCSTLPQPTFQLPHSSILKALFSRGSGPLANFERTCLYLIPFHLALYQEWGLALEAHLQNCILLWSPTGPQGLWVRDWGGLRANVTKLRRRTPTHFKRLPAHSLTLTNGVSARRKLIACLYSNHLSELVFGLTQAFELDEKALWTIVKRTTQDSLKAWPRSELSLDILKRPWPVKSLLRMRLTSSLDDIYVQIPNPFLNL